ncbi:shikimate kinase [Longibacter salinarum]|nr:shikimate kinase [Longibacter salinarum]
MRIYLSGFMASGKSTVGPLVAERRDLDFLDLDDAIEDEANRSVPEIFAIEGELGFRQRETKALWATAENDDVVVSLGGGTIVSKENRDWAMEHGLVVTLQVDADTILDRVADEADHRPLLQDENEQPLARQAMRRRIEQMLSERRAAYEQVHAVVDADREPDVVASVIDEIATVWKHRGEVHNVG